MLRSLSLISASTVCRDGVMPDPPEMKPMLRNERLSPDMVVVKLFIVSGVRAMPTGRSMLKANSPRGPLNSRQSVVHNRQRRSRISQGIRGI